MNWDLYFATIIVAVCLINIGLQLARICKVLTLIYRK